MMKDTCMLLEISQIFINGISLIESALTKYQIKAVLIQLT